jgi:hypothetical protein
LQGGDRGFSQNASGVNVHCGKNGSRGWRPINRRAGTMQRKTTNGHERTRISEVNPEALVECLSTNEPVDGAAD